MDKNHLEAILQKLSLLEEEFYQTASQEDYHERTVYDDFVARQCIQGSQWAEIYWPQLPFSEEFKERQEAFRILNNVTVLSEDSLFLSGNITLMKQITFPFEHYLENDFFQCVYVIEGSAVIKMDRASLELKKGDFFILFPNVRHLLNASNKSVVVNILIKRNRFWYDKIRAIEAHYSYLNLSDESRREKELAYILFHTDDNRKLKDTILAMFVEYLDKDAYFNDVLDGYLLLLISFLLRYKAGEVHLSCQPTRSQAIFEEIYRYCANNFRDATLSEAAERLHFSRQYVCRIIKEQTGGTFSHLVMGLKIEQVKKYLLGTSLTLDAIADLTGYTDAAHLSRSFKAREGVPPMKYRDLKKTRHEEES